MICACRFVRTRTAISFVVTPSFPKAGGPAEEEFLFEETRRDISWATAPAISGTDSVLLIAFEGPSFSLIPKYHRMNDGENCGSLDAVFFPETPASNTIRSNTKGDFVLAYMVLTAVIRPGSDRQFLISVNLESAV